MSATSASSSLQMTKLSQIVEFTDRETSIQAIMINNIDDSFDGWWFGCNITKCLAQDFSFKIFESIEWMIGANKHNSSLPKVRSTSYMYFYDRSLVIKYWRFTEYYYDYQAKFSFDGQVMITFFGCHFSDITGHELFDITNAANVIFDSCYFAFNAAVLLTLSTGSIVNIENSGFLNNTGNISRPLIQINESTVPTTLNIINSDFEYNTGYTALIYVSQCCTIHYIYMHGLKILNNHNQYDYFGDGETEIIISNSSFRNTHTQFSSLSLNNVRNITIQNTIWSQFIADSIIYKNSQHKTSITLENITIENTNSKPIYINSTHSIINVVSSHFHNIYSSSNGGCIEIIASQSCLLENNIFERCNSDLYGGAIFFNQIPHIIISSSTFLECKSLFGGAIAFIFIDPMFDTNINLNMSTQFINNSALIGSGIYLSRYKPMIIAQTEPFNVSKQNTEFNKSLTMNIQESDLFETEYIFVTLSVTGNISTDTLQWIKSYKWDNNTIQIANNYGISHVDSSRYMSTFFIPLRLADKSMWRISNEFDWVIQLHFHELWDSLLDDHEQLFFNILLLAYDSDEYNEVNTIQSFSMSMIDVIFEDNYANILSALYITDLSYSHVNISLYQVDFNRNIGYGLSSIGIDLSNNTQTTQLYCNQCHFDNNIAYSSTACVGLFNQKSSSSVVLSFFDSIIQSNYAMQSASTIYIRNAQLIISKSIITNNHSPLGSNILVDSSKMYLYDSIFNGNKASKSGGSVITTTNVHELVMTYWNISDIDDLIKIENCTFMHNIGKNAAAISIPITNNMFTPLTKFNFFATRRLLQTDEQSVSMQTTGGFCAGMMIDIDSDFHVEDISWTVLFSDGQRVDEHSTYGCIMNISQSIQCANFSIWDKFGDGLNYGQGGYVIKWKERVWKSPSSGNYGISESLMICPSSYTELEYLTVLVRIQDEESLSFLEFLDNELLLLLDSTINYKVVFDITPESIADNTTCLDCKYGYCACNAFGNASMQNIIAALCYETDPILQDVYNYTWEDFWSDSSIENHCISNTKQLLEDNYHNLSMFQTYNAPSFYVGSQTSRIIETSLYMSIISSAYMYPYCDLYSELYDLIYPICNSLKMNYSVNLPFCQSIDCYSTYCDTNEAYLHFMNYATFKYVPFEETVGTQALTNAQLFSPIYGANEYVNKQCYLGTNITTDMINNTIPILLGNIPSCDYSNVVYKFQTNGARAVILATGDDTHKFVNVSWIPYNCIIMFNQSLSDYFNTFTVVKPELNQELSYVFESNIQELDTTDYMNGSILYRFRVNNSDELQIPDTLVSRYVDSYLKLHLLVDIHYVDCIHGPIIIEMPTFVKSTIYDKIHIPVALNIMNITKFVNEYQSEEVEILCGTNSPTTVPPSLPPTEEEFNYVLFTPPLLDWNSSELYCQQHCNSHLASIHSNKSFEVIKNLITTVIGRPAYFVWIGLNDYKNEGLFEWTDGTAVNFGNITNPMGIYPWNSNNPNNYGGFQHSIAIKADTTNPADDGWNDLQGTAYTLPFVCNSCTTNYPTQPPTKQPTEPEPTVYPTLIPTTMPTIQPTLNPSNIPTFIPTNNPTINPTKPTVVPSNTPTSYPTVIPTPYPTNNDTIIKDKPIDFVIFTYQNENILQMGITFPYLSVAEFVKVYTDVCQLELDTNMVIDNDEYVYYITIDTFFEQFSSICVQFNDGSNITLVDWTIVENQQSSLHLTTTTSQLLRNGCISSEYSTSIPIIERGTYCIAIWTNKRYDTKDLEYNIKIKRLFKWTPSFIKINNCHFINNTNIEGKGGAIAITTDKDIYEFISISINNTIFDSNFASLGGTAIYRKSTQSKYTNKHYLLMSVLEMNNIQIYNKINENLYDSIKTELITSETNGFIFRNAIYVSDMFITKIPINNKDIALKVTEKYGGLINLQGSNVYIKDSNISKGNAYNGGCIWINDTSLTLYNTQIEACKASNNGGALYHSLYTEYALYHLCFSTYYSTFIDNIADNSGGGAYLILRGEQKSLDCVRTFNTEYIANEVQYGEGNSMYLYVFNGSHKLLDNFELLSNVCNDEKCKDFRSTLRYLCVTKVQNGTCDFYTVQNDRINITVPDSEVTLYVFGEDAFRNHLNSTRYEIQVFSDNATIQERYGHISTDHQYYIIPLVIDINRTKALLIIKDQNNVASSLDILLNIEPPIFEYIVIIHMVKIYCIYYYY
eukprot:206068_1